MILDFLIVVYFSLFITCIWLAIHLTLSGVLLSQSTPSSFSKITTLHHEGEMCLEQLRNLSLATNATASLPKSVYSSANDSLTMTPRTSKRQSSPLAFQRLQIIPSGTDDSVFDYDEGYTTSPTVNIDPGSFL